MPINETDIQVVLFSKIDLEKEDRTIITTFDAVLSAVVEPLNNNEEIDKLIKNIAAILYSYLRPLIAQMTVMSKLPPLDLPPLNFTDIDYIDLSNVADNK